VDLTTDARVALLDGFALALPGGCPAATADDLPHGVQRLVAYLSLYRRPARTAIAGELWPEVPEDNAHRSLRSALWRLQKVAPGLVEVSGGTLSLARTVRVDVRELTEWAQRMLDPGSDADASAAPDVGLRGELLPGWYDDWVLLERERLRQLRMHALEALAGKLARAVRAYDAFRAMLAEELGVAPSQQMDRLICDLPRPRSGTAERERSARVTAR
jgi:DNA-binding SARP family transcriptional activator